MGAGAEGAKKVSTQPAGTWVRRFEGKSLPPATALPAGCVSEQITVVQNEMDGMVICVLRFKERFPVSAGIRYLNHARHPDVLPESVVELARQTAREYAS